MRNFPILSDFSSVIRVRFEVGLADLLRRAHVDKKLHFVLLVLYAIQSCLDAELCLWLDELHVLWQLVLFLHLTQPVIIFLLVFRVAYLNHVLTEQAQELWLTHRLLNSAIVLLLSFGLLRLSVGVAIASCRPGSFLYFETIIVLLINIKTGSCHRDSLSGCLCAKLLSMNYEQK